MLARSSALRHLSASWHTFRPSFQAAAVATTELTHHLDLCVAYIGGEARHQSHQSRAFASSSDPPPDSQDSGNPPTSALPPKPVGGDGLIGSSATSRRGAGQEGGATGRWESKGTGSGLILPGHMTPPRTPSADEPAQLITIDRVGLKQGPAHEHGDLSHKEPETKMARHLKALIRFRSGPITVAEYMSEVLTNPEAGYYMHRDVFGTAGDFVTSPEISQMFGEMVGIWCVCAWQQLGCPSSLRLVELGPGRGTLMADLVRGTAPFAAFASALQVDMVEVSPALRQEQWKKLRCQSLPNSNNADGEVIPPPSKHTSDSESLGSTLSVTSEYTEGAEVESAPLEGVSGFGNVEVRWHRSLEEVPSDVPVIVIAHEFFDALPVHQFQLTERGWCERLVNVATDEDPGHLRFVLSPGVTPAVKLLVDRRLAAMPADEAQDMQALEVGAQGMATAAALAARVMKSGGAALVLDYGRDSAYPASARAIRKHEFVDLLQQPGDADLSTHVDFSGLRQAVEEGGSGATCHGPVTQTHFLRSLGIDARLEALQAAATPEDAAQLRAGYERLLGSGILGDDMGEGMGLSYKAFAISSIDTATPVAFETDAE